MGGGGIGGAIGGLVAGPMGLIPGAVAGNNWNSITGQKSGGPGAMGLAGEMPTRPDWQSNLDPQSGLLKSNLQSTWTGINPETSGLDAYKNMALGSGPTDQAKAQLTQQGLEEQNQRQNFVNQNAGSQSNARSQLASKYGLSAGASERLAKSGMRDESMGLQNVGAQGAQARATIGANDAATRNQFLAGLPGAQNQNTALQLQNAQLGLGNQQYNINNALQEQTQKRAADLNAYNQQMSVWGANKNADAMQAQGSGGKK